MAVMAETIVDKVKMRKKEKGKDGRRTNLGLNQLLSSLRCRHLRGYLLLNLNRKDGVGPRRLVVHLRLGDVADHVALVDQPHHLGGVGHHLRRERGG